MPKKMKQKKEKVNNFAEFADYLSSYADIEIIGFFAEQLINKATDENIELWQIRRIKQDIVTARCHLTKLKNLLEIIDENDGFSTNLTINVKQKKGLLPLLHKYRLRSGILAGIIVFIALLTLMLSFVWSINIEGLKNVSERGVLEVLQENGFYTGSFTFGHNLEKLKLALMKKYDEIAYVTINIQGSTAFVEVTESVMPPQVVKRNVPCNIVAARDGVLLLAEAYEGVVKVKNYQAVTAGDLLVSGIFPSRVIGYRLVHSSAKMIALTKRTFTEFCPYEKAEIVATGRQKNLYSLKIFNLNLKIPFMGRNLYSFYDIIKEETQLSLGEKNFLPIYFIKEEVYEQENVITNYDTAQAKAYLQALIEERIRVELQGLEIQDIKTEFTETDTGVSCTYTCMVVEDIALEREIYREDKK